MRRLLLLETTVGAGGAVWRAGSVSDRRAPVADAPGSPLPPGGRRAARRRRKPPPGRRHGLLVLGLLRLQPADELDILLDRRALRAQVVAGHVEDRQLAVAGGALLPPLVGLALEAVRRADVGVVRPPHVLDVAEQDAQAALLRVGAVERAVGTHLAEEV